MVKKSLLLKAFSVLFCGIFIHAHAAERVVVSGDYDYIDYILEELGWDYELIKGSQLADYDLSETKQLYINCGSFGNASPPPLAIAKVKEWVEAGGYLYASDWSYEYIEAWGWEFDYDGVAGNVSATVEDSGLKSYIGSDLVDDKLPIKYDQQLWGRIINPANATVLLRGDVVSVKGGTMVTIINSPLAMTLKVGNGSVIYTTFHNHSGGIAQPGMKKAVEYFAMVPAAQASADKLLANNGLVSDKMVGLAIGTFEQAADNGIQVQGIPSGFGGKYLFQVTDIRIKGDNTHAPSPAANSYVVQLISPKGVEYIALEVSGHDSVAIDVPAAENDGKAWTFKILNAVGYEGNQSVIAVSWQGELGGGDGGAESAAGAGSEEVDGESSGCGGCNTAGGPFGLVSLALMALFVRRKLSC